MLELKSFSTSELIEEIENILKSQPSKDVNYISLYEVVKLIRNKNNEYKDLKKRYAFLLGEHFRSCKPKYIHFEVADFDYENNELKIEIDNTPVFRPIYHSIIFKKENEEIYVKETETDWSSDILYILKDELSELYDKFLKFSKFKKTKEFKVIPLNCQFDIKIYVKYFTYISAFLKEHSFFMLRFSNEISEYKYDGFISSSITDILYNNEDNLLRNILIKISDFPEWMQPVFYETRRQEIEELQRIESQEGQKLLRNERIKSTIRKILPFV